MRKNKQLFLCLSLVAMVTGCVSGNNNNRSGGNGAGDEYRRVGHAVWHKEEAIDASKLVSKAIPANSAGVFFYRAADNDGLQSSANVSINDRFQSSLQPGNYTQVYSCTGVNELSVDITGNKHNDLLRGRSAFNLEPGKNYFFDVDVTESGVASIREVSEQIALEAMKNMPHQTHQISRVVPNCTQAPSRIELKVLFDTDKHFIKEFYYPEIKRVSDYMKKYPKTTAVIEGHTDSRASDSYNMALSQRRVDAVRSVLINHFGVDANRLSAVGYGESRPIASNDTAEGMQQNRRVIAVFSYGQ